MGASRVGRQWGVQGGMLGMESSWRQREETEDAGRCTGNAARYQKCSRISEMQVEMEGGILAGWDGGCRRGVLETGDSQRCCRGQIGHFWGDGRWNPPSL